MTNQDDLHTLIDDNIAVHSAVDRIDDARVRETLHSMVDSFPDTSGLVQSISDVASALPSKLDVTKKPVVATVNALRTLTVASDVLYQSVDNGGGHWYHDPADTDSADNTGTVVVTAEGKRLKRIFNSAIDVKWFGAVAGTDSTTAIQNAINYAAGKYKVLIDEGYIVNVNAANAAALVIPSDSHIIFGKNGVLSLAATSNSSYGILLIKTVANVTIEGGKIIGDRTTHIGTTGESGHGIMIGSLADNISIFGTDIANCWGDGICIAAFSNTDDASTNISIDDVYCHNNRRQGLSVISAKRVKVTNSRFEDTSGTAPQAGIDLEPNKGNVVQDVVIDNCYFSNNVGGGLVITGNDATALTNNIIVTNCTIKGSPQTSLMVGSIGIVSNALISDIIIEQPANSTGHALNTSISTNVTVKNVNIIADGSSPYAVVKQYGNGVIFDNLKIRANTPKIGISCTYAANNVRITNCDIDVANHAIEFLLQSGEVKSNVTIQNNILKSSGAVGSKCIYISDVRNGDISNNKILGAGYSGIEIYRCSNLNVSKNTLQDCGGFRNLIDACISVDLTTDTTVKENYGRLGTAYTNKVGYGLKMASSGAGTRNLIVKDNNFLDTFSTVIKNYSTEVNTVEDASIPKTGTTAGRPTLDANKINADYYDTTISKFAKWNGSAWVTIADSADLSAIGAKANDNAVVHNSGAETVAGAKTFSAQVTVADGLGTSSVSGVGFNMARSVAYIKNTLAGASTIFNCDIIQFRESTNTTTIFGLSASGVTLNTVGNTAGDFVTRDVSNGILTKRTASQVLGDIGAAPKTNPVITGTVTADKFKLSSLNTAPTSATDTGAPYEVRITADYIYVCIATNTWVRAALTTW